MTHPKRYMRDGTATTRRVRGVQPVDCDNPAHVTCFVAVTSWAGDPIPRPDDRWHAYVSRSGAVCLLGPDVGRETPQFQAGLKRRVRRALETTAAGRDVTGPYRGAFAVYRGQLAYLDTFAGLVPVKVTAVDDAGAVTVKVTAARRGYARGEILADQRAGRDIVPRTAVFVRAGQYRIAGAPVRAIPDSELAGGASQ